VHLPTSRPGEGTRTGLNYVSNREKITDMKKRKFALVSKLRGQKTEASGYNRHFVRLETRKTKVNGGPLLQLMWGDGYGNVKLSVDLDSKAWHAEKLWADPSRPNPRVQSTKHGHVTSSTPTLGSLIEKVGNELGVPVNRNARFAAVGRFNYGYVTKDKIDVLSPVTYATETVTTNTVLPTAADLRNYARL